MRQTGESAWTEVFGFTQQLAFPAPGRGSPRRQFFRSRVCPGAQVIVFQKLHASTNVCRRAISFSPGSRRLRRWYTPIPPGKDAARRDAFHLARLAAEVTRSMLTSVLTRCRVDRCARFV